MSGKFQLKEGISEPSSDIPLNWRDMRSEFEYKLLYAMPCPKIKEGNPSMMEFKEVDYVFHNGKMKPKKILNEQGRLTIPKN